MATTKTVTVAVEVPRGNGDIFTQWRNAKREFLAARESLDLECRKVVEEIYRETGQLVGKTGYIEKTRFISYHNRISAEKGVVTFGEYKGTCFYLANAGLETEYGRSETETWEMSLSTVREITAKLLAVKEMARELFLKEISQ